MVAVVATTVETTISDQTTNSLDMKGTVKWYDATKGFGFILTEDNKDIFVHRSGLVNAFAGLEPDETVEFEIGQGKKGPVATNVTKVD